VFHAVPVLTRERDVALGGGDWLAAGARGLELTNEVAVGRGGAALAGTLCEVGEGEEVGAVRPGAWVGQAEVRHAGLQGPVQGLGRAAAAVGGRRLQHVFRNTC